MRRVVKIKRTNTTDQKIDQLTDLVRQLIDNMEFSNQQFPHAEGTSQQLIDIQVIKKYTGYSDSRSAKKWLLKNGITPFDEGRKTYISALAWNNYIKLKTEGDYNVQNFNFNDDKKSTLVSKNKKSNSKAATDFLKNIKSA